MRRRAPEVLLRTDRLTLRRFTPADADALRALDSDPEVVRYSGDGLTGVPPDRAATEQRLKGFVTRYGRDGALAFWATEDRATGAFLGWFQFTPTDTAGEAELGFRLVKAAWGRGRLRVPPHRRVQFRDPPAPVAQRDGIVPGQPRPVRPQRTFRKSAHGSPFFRARCLSRDGTA